MFIVRVNDARTGIGFVVVVKNFLSVGVHFIQNLFSDIFLAPKIESKVLRELGRGKVNSFKCTGLGVSDNLNEIINSRFK